MDGRDVDLRLELVPVDDVDVVVGQPEPEVSVAPREESAEPGLGVVNFDAVLGPIQDDYDGDFMIEVDHPSVDSRFESHRISFEWAKNHL